MPIFGRQRGYGGRGYGGRRRGAGGFKLRLMIALAIAAFSFVSYYSASDKNPITGESQRVGMTEEQEVALGLQAMPAMVQQHGGEYPDTHQAVQQMDRVGMRLLEALDQWVRESNGSNPYRFDFHLLADKKTLNAFALPGGQVFITEALYSKLETEGQLAGVLGHEIGHVIARHGAQRMAKQKLTQGLTGAAGVAGGGFESARMAQAIGQMVNMKYGRKDELESDKWGVLLCLQAGYDPRSMKGVMEILDSASGGKGPPEMMSTHPKPANRIKYINDVIAEIEQKHFPDGLPGGLIQ